MFIKITKKDCQNIVNENLQGGVTKSHLLKKHSPKSV